MYKLLGVLLGLVALGCASIVSKSTYPVTFDSNPTGATIVISDIRGVRVFEGTTPITLTLSAKNGYFSRASYTVEASLEGYNQGVITLYARLAGWYIGNLLIGGLIGFVVIDPLTGAMWKLDDRIVVNLGRRPETSEADGMQVVILSIDQLSPHLRQHLVPLR